MIHLGLRWVKSTVWRDRPRRARLHQRGIEGARTKIPIKWDNGYFENLLGYEWELTKSPAGAHQWQPVGATGNGTVPDAHDQAKHRDMGPVARYFGPLVPKEKLL